MELATAHQSTIPAAGITESRLLVAELPGVTTTMATDERLQQDHDLNMTNYARCDSGWHNCPGRVIKFRVSQFSRTVVHSRWSYGHCVDKSLPRCRPEDPSLLLAGARDLYHWSCPGLMHAYIVSLQPRCSLDSSDPDGCAARPAGARKLTDWCSL